MVRCIINRILLDFWIEIETTTNVATVFVKKHNDQRSLNILPPIGAEKYPVVSIDNTGKLWRHRGLPSGWGFELTADRKIKEIK